MIRSFGTWRTLPCLRGDPRRPAAQAIDALLLEREVISTHIFQHERGSANRHEVTSEHRAEVVDVSLCELA
jgi:hypothetical protein